MTITRDAAHWRKLADEVRPEGRAFIDGAYVDAVCGETFDSVDPATGAVLGKVAAGGAADVDRAVAAARRKGSLVAFDPNYRPRLWPSPEAAQTAMTQALGVTDIALPTFTDEQALFADASPEATAERLGRAGVKEIVVKNGEEPALVVAEGRTQTVPAMLMDNLVDTTGAGDLFAGGFLAGLAKGLEHTDCARLSAMAATNGPARAVAKCERKIRGRGARRLNRLSNPPKGHLQLGRAPSWTCRLVSVFQPMQQRACITLRIRTCAMWSGQTGQLLISLIHARVAEHVLKSAVDVEDPQRYGLCPFQQKPPGPFFVVLWGITADGFSGYELCSLSCDLTCVRRVCKLIERYSMHARRYRVPGLHAPAGRRAYEA